MNFLRILNIIRRVIFYPLMLVALPAFLIIGFFLTNFEDESDRKFYFGSIKKMLTAKF